MKALRMGRFVIYNVSLYPLIIDEMMPNNMTVKPDLDTAAEKLVISVPAVFNQCRPNLYLK